MTDADIAKASAKILLDTKSVSFNAEEPFVYTSGAIGPVYVDCRRLISFPDARGQLMDFSAKKVKDLNLDYIAGGETAGIPYAAFIAERLNKPMLYIRKKPKGFGRMAQIEGCMDEEGKNVLLVEDVQNFGVSIKIFIDALRNANAVIEHASVIFEHGHATSRKNMEEMGVKLHALCSWTDVLAEAKNGDYGFDANTLNSVEQYLQDPKAWTDQNAHKVKEQAG